MPYPTPHQHERRLPYSAQRERSTLGTFRRAQLAHLHSPVACCLPLLAGSFPSPPMPFTGLSCAVASYPYGAGGGGMI